VVATKLDLKEWVVEAVKAHGGVAHPIDIAQVNYHDELQGTGDLFYTWQHNVQWVLPKSKGHKGPWRLAACARRHWAAAVETSSECLKVWHCGGPDAGTGHRCPFASIKPSTAGNALSASSINLFA
jgi:hypothetical protein